MRLTIDKSGSAVQTFSPNPLYCHPVTAIPNGNTLSVDINAEGVGWIKFKSSGKINIYLNDDTSNLMEFEANTIYDICMNLTIQKINFKNTSGSSVTLYRWGM